MGNKSKLIFRFSVLTDVKTIPNFDQRKRQNSCLNEAHDENRNLHVHIVIEIAYPEF